MPGRPRRTSSADASAAAIEIAGAPCRRFRLVVDASVILRLGRARQGVGLEMAPCRAITSALRAYVSSYGHIRLTGIAAAAASLRPPGSGNRLDARWFLAHWKARSGRGRRVREGGARRPPRDQSGVARSALLLHFLKGVWLRRRAPPGLVLMTAPARSSQPELRWCAHDVALGAVAPRRYRYRPCCVDCDSCLRLLQGRAAIR